MVHQTAFQVVAGDLIALYWCIVFDVPQRGKLFYLQLELFYLQLSFFAYSPLKALSRRTFPL